MIVKYLDITSMQNLYLTCKELKEIFDKCDYFWKIICNNEHFIHYKRRYSSLKFEESDSDKFLNLSEILNSLEYSNSDKPLKTLNWKLDKSIGFKDLPFRSFDDNWSENRKNIFMYFSNTSKYGNGKLSRLAYFS